MIEVFYYSISGKKSNQVIDDLIQMFLDSEYTPSNERKVLKHIQEVAKNGNYPTKEYFKLFYPESAYSYNSLAEIKTYCKSAMDFYHKQFLEKKIISAINDTNDSAALISSLQSLLDQGLTVDSSELDDLKPITYGSLKDTPTEPGIKTGVKELDDVTGGLQPGNVASVCAFTGHGKSTFVESIAFNNALEGKKVCLVSLELAPDIIWSQLEARYMNQVKGIQVNSQNLRLRKLSSDIDQKVTESEQDFINEICSNIVVIDEAMLSKQTMLNYKSLSMLMRKIATKLNGLDIVIFDHVGQFELMYPDCGNKIIKSIQSFTKTFKDSRDKRPISIMAVQANRQGEIRARKRGGVYDLQAISDLNEVERTSSYIVFMYTSDDMNIMQETKITLSKHRLGPVLTEPIVTTFNPAIITVGASIEEIVMSDDDFNDLDLDLGGSFDSFDNF